MLVTTEPLTKTISGVKVTETLKDEFDAARKARGITVAQASREAWAAWTASQKPGQNPTGTPSGKDT